jgi:hypothetical protein
MCGSRKKFAADMKKIENLTKKCFKNNKIELVEQKNLLEEKYTKKCFRTYVTICIYMKNTVLNWM